MAVDLRKSPYNLDDEGVAWVEQTLSGMNLDEKIGQMFCPGVAGIGPDQIREFAVEKKLGSIMIRPMPAAMAGMAIRGLQEASRVPMLIAANLESGGDGALAEGNLYEMPMGCTATGDMESGYRLGKIACQEAAAIGLNWSFAPIVDIDNNYGNPITNIRAFSGDPNQVIAMAKNYLKAAAEEGVAVSCKHFPGDGCDERDQHLLVSVNDRSYEEWMDTYGRIYREMIASGCQTIMVGHIAQPAVARHLAPDISDWDAFLPGSQSRVLIDGCLRGELGFNGMLVTDSTLMVGYMQKMPRKEALAATVNAGIDMILFNRNLDEDWTYLKKAIESGVISQSRIDEAVTRILGVKASLNLHKKQAAGTLVPNTDAAAICASPVTSSWMQEVADKAVTLVKDPRQVLPLSPEKTRRIYLNVIEAEAVNNSPFALNIKERLEREGFEVTLRERALNIDMGAMMRGEMTPDMMKAMAEIQMTTESFVSQYDMSMIVLNIETISNATTVRVNWKVLAGLGNDIPWYSGEMPVVVMSTANPYHLLDVPMADVYVNTYSSAAHVLDAAFEKLMGRSEFKGTSPVDPFCGHEDTRL